jgi:hypothetical protein
MTYHTRRPSPIQHVSRGLSRLRRTASDGGLKALALRRVLVSVVATLTALLGIGVVTAQPAAAAPTHYTIYNATGAGQLDNGGMRSAGAALITEYFTGTDRQRWSFQYMGMGYYKLVNALSTHCLSRSGSSAIQDYCSTAPSWLLWHRDNGSYELRLSMSGPCLDVDTPYLPGTTVRVNACVAGKVSQGWYLSGA